MQPTNAIIGDATGFDLPESRVDEKQLLEEKRLARFAHSKEFQELKAHFADRIAYYQSYMPGNIPITEVKKEERDAYWVAAEVIINELRAVTTFYEATAEVVEDAQE